MIDSLILERGRGGRGKGVERERERENMNSGGVTGKPVLHGTEIVSLLIKRWMRKAHLAYLQGVNNKIRSP